MINFFKRNSQFFLLSVTAILFGLFCAFLFYRLGVHAFIDWDESIYAQIAKEALQSKNFFDFTYFGVPWYEKPPLGIWLVSAAYALGGINEWSARMPATLAAIGTVLLSLKWVWEIRKSYTAVIMTMASYFIMFPFITAAYFVNMDSIIGFFILFALYAWWKAKDNHNWYYVWGVAIGLAVMTKSVVGLFPIAPFGLYALLQWDFAFVKAKKFWYAVGIGALIVVPWHVYQSIVAGQAFWDVYFRYHVLNRFSTDLETNGQPANFYIQLVFLRYYLALAIFGGGTIIAAIIAWKDAAMRYVFLCGVMLFIIFSLSTTKLPSYISAVVPFFVMFSGIGIAKLVGYIPRKWMSALVVIILSVSFVYTGYAFNQYKIAQGEFGEEYDNNKKAGLFLKDYRKDLPVYTNNAAYKNLGVAFYAERTVLPNLDKAIIDGATEKVFHTHLVSVYLGDGYIMVIR